MAAQVSGLIGFKSMLRTTGVMCRQRACPVSGPVRDVRPAFAPNGEIPWSRWLADTAP